jgi:MYXO-CTERM domain-containing protein
MGPLSGYLGSACTHASVSFDLWSYDPGATGVAAADVLVIPSAADAVFEFLQTGTGWTQPIGAATSGSIGFRGTGIIGGTRLYLGFGGFSGTTGGVTLITDMCIGSTLPGCIGGSLPAPISSYNVAGLPPVILSEAFYPLAASVDILTTFTIEGGDDGAGLSTFESGFYAVPEPSAALLAAAGLAALALIRRK